MVLHVHGIFIMNISLKYMCGIFLWNISAEYLDMLNYQSNLCFTLYCTVCYTEHF